MDLIETLRGDKGCPWDREQSPKSLSIYLIEELYELVEAIEEDERDSVCEELGDVLFHILFIIVYYQDKGEFRIEDVIRRVLEKMIRRHPHVFGDKPLESADDVRIQWQEIKAMEKRDKPSFHSILDFLPGRLPALMRAFRVSESAAQANFDWDDISGVVRKAEEEWMEFKSELINYQNKQPGKEELSLEFGDLLFTLVNVARFVGIHPETALAASTRKFEKRFKFLERVITESGRDMDSVSQGEKDAIWKKAKEAFSH